jgi:hypothetical protein
MRKREEICHIKLSSYIEENIRFSRLFHTQNHPTEDFLAFLASEICIYLESIIGKNIMEPITYTDNYSSSICILYDSILMTNELGLEYMNKEEEYILWNYISFIYEKNNTSTSEIISTHSESMDSSPL